MSEQPRWFTEMEEGYSDTYVERFRRMADAGEDLAGEARLMDALVPPRSRILDAGCGPGRVGAELYARGHDVTGIDVDPVLVHAAQDDHPGPTWEVGDLAAFTLDGPPFDAAVVAGNVMVFVAPGTERKVLERIRAHVRPGGRIVVGFRRDDAYPLARFDDDVAALDLVVEHRFATWDLVPMHDDADFAVTLLRVP